jgi:hypothetical protein
MLNEVRLKPQKARVYKEKDGWCVQYRGLTFTRLGQYHAIRMGAWLASPPLSYERPTKGIV